MKSLGIILTAVIMASFSAMKVDAKKAILIAHYGSTDDITRALTIDRITSDIREAFPDFMVREAYISSVVRKNLDDKGVMTDSPVEALFKLKVEGYDSVYIQSTTIIDGAEMDEVRKSVEKVSQFFDFVRTGNSLLHTPEDCNTLVEILREYPVRPGEAVVYVGHGNNLPSTATYTQLDYMASLSESPVFHVSTIEGYPTADSTLCQLKRMNNIRKVTLIPLLLVCGNHTKNDIAVDFAQSFRNNGYEVEVLMRGLAELPQVRQLYVNRVRDLIN